MNKPEIILIGGGGHCNSCIDVIELQDQFKIIGIIDIAENIGKKVLNYPIIGCDNDLEKFSKLCKNFIVCLGQIKDNSKRKNAYEQLNSLNVNIPVIISPLAYVSKHSMVGAGTMIFHNVIVNSNVVIENNCIINSRALIEHDSKIGSHCHISTGAIINGGVKIGSGTFFGSGAVSKEYIEIPENSFIKANSIVK